MWAPDGVPCWWEAPGHGGSKDVAAAGHGPDDPVRVIVEGTADVANALGDAIVGDNDVGPNGLIECVAVQQPSCIRHKEMQELEGLSPKRHFLTTCR